MRVLEPQIMEVMTLDAMTTTEVIRAVLGELAPIDKARKGFHEALVCLEDDGAVESRLCYIDGLPTRYWVLPGGTFPEVEGKPLTDRIADALADGPMGIEAIYQAVYTDAERRDPQNARKRLSKALNRLADRNTIERCECPQTGQWTPSTWRMRRWD